MNKIVWARASGEKEGAQCPFCGEDNYRSLTGSKQILQKCNHLVGFKSGYVGSRVVFKPN